MNADHNNSGILRRVAREVICGWRRWRTRLSVRQRLPAFLEGLGSVGHGLEGRVVCISRIEHMGDIIACEPVARLIRAEEPAATIVFCVADAFRSLIEHNPNVDAVLSVNDLYEWSLWAKSAAFGRVIDLNFEKHPDGRHGYQYQRPDDNGVNAWN